MEGFIHEGISNARKHDSKVHDLDEVKCYSKAINTFYPQTTKDTSSQNLVGLLFLLWRHGSWGVCENHSVRQMKKQGTRGKQKATLTHLLASAH